MYRRRDIDNGDTASKFYCPSWVERAVWHRTMQLHCWPFFQFSFSNWQKTVPIPEMCLTKAYSGYISQAGLALAFYRHNSSHAGCCNFRGRKFRRGSQWCGGVAARFRRWKGQPVQKCLRSFDPSPKRLAYYNGHGSQWGTCPDLADCGDEHDVNNRQLCFRCAWYHCAETVIGGDDGSSFAPKSGSLTLEHF